MTITYFIDAHFLVYDISFHYVNHASLYIYVRETNRMHLYLINLFQLNYPLHFSNKYLFETRRGWFRTNNCLKHAEGSLTGIN
jgi:hypothetical protein